ncbi:type II toxin-antitoxin system VapC family toxin [Patescibacteria group bacterium]|nr:type II toxin-antitoxin system VapC family toxin [Patescibacteria group bacterium]
MNYLIDTHIFLWTVFYPKKLPKRIKDILLDPEAIIYVSLITFWEISLKYQLGKISLTGILPDKLPMIAKKSGFETLNLDVDTTASFYKLPKLKNKDLFDRMLTWQAICSDYHLLTQDQDFADYKDHGLKIV